MKLNVRARLTVFAALASVLPAVLAPVRAAVPGLAFAWGNNGNGALGNGSTTQSNVPVAVDTTGVLAAKSITAVASGQFHSIALASDGTLYAWGDNNSSQLGLGFASVGSTTPVAVDMTGALAGKTITAIAAGNTFSLALDSTGKVYVWGSGPIGNSGVPIGTAQTPAAVDTTGALAGKTITHIAAGSDFALARDSLGKVYSWGANGNGQLGRAGSGSGVPVAVDTAGVLSGVFITEIAAGAQHAVAVDITGKLYTWGLNNLGQLGNGVTGGTSAVPVAVSLTGPLATKVFTIAAAGNAHSLVMTSASELYAWGDGTQGQMGNGANISSNVPVAVTLTGALAGQTVSTIGCGYNHCIVRTQGDRVFTWGPNSNGALGIATIGIQNTPVAVDTTGVLNGYLVFSVGTGPAATRSVVAAVLSSPIITSMTPNQSVAAGASASFTVVATGVQLTYQWQKNATNIIGANAATYTIASTVPGDAGTYSVVVTNPAGSATVSRTLTITAPAITTQPANVTVNAGASASFSVVATGGGLTYQWFKNGAAISGANAATYTIASTVLGDAGGYVVRVTNVVGSVDSNTAVLTVNTVALPTITTHPVGGAMQTGSVRNLSVVATGGTLTYQWFKGANAIIGATASTYSLGPVAFSDAGTYTVRVTNLNGSVTSNPAVITVDDPIGISSFPPPTLNVNLGASASIAVVATGTNLSYQWSKNGNAIIGANAATYTIPTTVAGDAGSYVVTVSNPLSTLSLSPTNLIIIFPPPVITTQPISQTVALGQSASFTVVANGQGLSYSWGKVGSGPIAGTNAPTYSIPSVTANDVGGYFVVVSNNGGQAGSVTVFLTVTGAPVITSQPLSRAIQVGSPVTFAVAATSSSSIAYQWKKNGVDIAGATNASYTISSVVVGDAANYSVLLTNAVGPTVSGLATLTVLTQVITTQPVSQTVTAGSSASFSVVATGSGTVTYQWRKNGTNIPAATTASYTIPNTVLADAGSYDVIVGDANGTLQSSTATLTVNAAPPPPPPPPPPVAQPQTITFLPFGSKTYGDPMFGVNVLASSGLPVALTVASGPATINGIFVTLTGAGPVTLNAAQAGNASYLPATASTTFTVAKAPAAVALANLTRTFDGAPKPATVTTTPAGLATAVTYNGSATAPSAAGTYAVSAIVNDANYTGTATGTLVIAVALPVFTQQPAGRAVVAGEAVTFTATVASTPTATLQWRLNGAPIAGATGASYTLPVATPVHAGDYTVVATNPAGSVTSAVAELAVAPDQRLANLSARAQVGATDNLAIAGFVIDGTAPRPVLLRAVGPTLADLAVPGAAARTTLSLFQGATRLAQNTGWATAANAADLASTATALGAFALRPNSADSALLVTLAPGAYTAVVNAADAAGGVALVEVYDTARTAPGLLNLSCRGQVGTGGQVFITGFVLTGNTPRRLLVRAVGPGLAAFGVLGPIADPQVQVLRGATVVASNDNWSDEPAIAAAAANAGAFPLAPASRDAAIVTTLESSAYTVVVSGVGPATGAVLVEIYQLP